jgi:hypothetical protein
MFLELALWLSLTAFVVGGYTAQTTSIWGASTGSSGFFGAAVGAIVWLLVAVIFFGAFLTLDDIRVRVKDIQEALMSKTQD